MPVLDPYALEESPEPEDGGAMHVPDDQEAGIGGADMDVFANSSEAHTQTMEDLTAANLYSPPDDIVLHQPDSSYTDDSFIGLHRGNGIATSADYQSQSQSMLAPANGDLDFIPNPAATLVPIANPGSEPFSATSNSIQYGHRSHETRKPQSKAGTETSHKTAFLLRHFSEVTGRWYV